MNTRHFMVTNLTVAFFVNRVKKMSDDDLADYEAEISPQNRLNALLKPIMGNYCVGNAPGYSTNDTLLLL